MSAPPRRGRRGAGQSTFTGAVRAAQGSLPKLLDPSPGQGCDWYVRAACWPPCLGRDACLSSVQGLAAGQVVVAGRAVRSPPGLDLLLG